MTIRRLRVLVRGLPDNARLVKVIRRRIEASDRKPTPIEELPPDAWSTTDYLLATVADKIEALTWMQADPQSRPSDPRWLPRPGQPAKKRRGAAAWFAGLGLGDTTT